MQAANGNLNYSTSEISNSDQSTYHGWGKVFFYLNYYNDNILRSPITKWPKALLEIMIFI